MIQRGLTLSFAAAALALLAACGGSGGGSGAEPDPFESLPDPAGEFVPISAENARAAAYAGSILIGYFHADTLYFQSVNAHPRSRSQRQPSLASLLELVSHARELGTARPTLLSSTEEPCETRGSMRVEDSSSRRVITYENFCTRHHELSEERYTEFTFNGTVIADVIEEPGYDYGARVRVNLRIDETTLDFGEELGSAEQRVVADFKVGLNHSDDAFRITDARYRLLDTGSFEGESWDTVFSLNGFMYEAVYAEHPYEPDVVTFSGSVGISGAGMLDGGATVQTVDAIQMPLEHGVLFPKGDSVHVQGEGEGVLELRYAADGSSVEILLDQETLAGPFTSPLAFQLWLWPLDEQL